MGLSLDTGRLGDSIDRDLVSDALERLDEFDCSPVAAFRFDLLSVRHTDDRGSESPLWLFCRRSVSANLFRNEEVLEVKDPAAE